MTSIRGVFGLAAIVAAIAGLAAVVLAGWQAVENPRPLVQELLSQVDDPADPADTSPRAFAIRPGETAAAISERLEAAGLVRNALTFRLMAELQGVAGDLAAGEYELSPAARPSEILAKLAEGKTRPAPLVTIPEGWRSEEIAERLAARGIGPAERFLEMVRRGTSDAPALASRPAGAGLEGYLFPDSYRFDSKTDPESMARRMVQQFDERLTPEMRAKAAGLGMTIHQVVTLASIIEREAVMPAERPLMAGVFYNRLQEGMPLQSDPTVQYAVATARSDSVARYGWWKVALTREDLATDSPYNTYVYPGLPPGPICNPGLASLRAALEPVRSEYIYFMARPDGSHAFARTLDEHNENVARYR